jgi:NAD(P)-dependent dehydrogenase (short-subunit alcohol dehydrogenase family)
MRDLRGKTAFVTGGASGIGLGMAKVFAGAGMNVCIADIREDHLDQARRVLEENGFADRCQFFALDVTDPVAYAEVAQRAEAAFGKIHVLCNNAGIGILTPLTEASEADWNWALSVNLTGIFNGVKAMLPAIRRHGEGGHVVNTASMAGILNYSRAGIYVTTKFAVVGLSEALRAELAPHDIGVSAFCPGGVHSNIREYEKTRPARFAKTEEVNSSPRSPPELHLSDEDRQRLSRLTATPEQAGELVLDGIRRNALYIFTAPEFRPGIEERHAAILDALGYDKERERTALELIPDLSGSSPARGGMKGRMMEGKAIGSRGAPRMALAAASSTG